jgi:hypothetical protein
MQQQAIRLLFHGIRDARPEFEQGRQASRRVHAHPQIDDHQIWIGCQVHGYPVYFRRHGNSLAFPGQELS